MKGITTSLLGNPWLAMFKTHHHNIFLIWFYNGPHQLNSNRRQIRNLLACDIITGSYSHDSNYKEPAGWPQKCTEIENANDGATIWNVKVNIWVSRSLHLHFTVILKSPILLGYVPTEGRVAQICFCSFVTQISFFCCCCFWITQIPWDVIFLILLSFAVLNQLRVWFLRCDHHFGIHVTLLYLPRMRIIPKTLKLCTRTLCENILAAEWLQHMPHGRNYCLFDSSQQPLLHVTPLYLTLWTHSKHDWKLQGNPGFIHKRFLKIQCGRAEC